MARRAGSIGESENAEHHNAAAKADAVSVQHARSEPSYSCGIGLRFRSVLVSVQNHYQADYGHCRINCPHGDEYESAPCMGRQKSIQASPTSGLDPQSEVENTTTACGESHQDHTKHLARRHGFCNRNEQDDEHEDVCQPEQVAAVDGNMREICSRRPFGFGFGIGHPHRAPRRLIRIDYAMVLGRWHIHGVRAAKNRLFWDYLPKATLRMAVVGQDIIFHRNRGTPQRRPRGQRAQNKHDCL